MMIVEQNTKPFHLPPLQSRTKSKLLIVRILRIHRLTVRILRSIIRWWSISKEKRVRVISRSRLREFWQTPGRKDAEALLSAWFKTVKHADWTKFADIKQLFASTDQVGNCLVFDIGNNRYRLIARVIYKTHCVYILRVMTHQEYDRQQWIDQCGCHSPSPKKKEKPKSVAPKQKKRR